MSYASNAALLALALFFGMLAALELGRRIGLWRRRRAPDQTVAGVGSVDGAVFGLLGLLVAFTFSGAASRFDARRTLIVTETNVVGTAWLRLDLLPSDARPAARNLFRSYLRNRLKTYAVLPDVEAAAEHLAEGARIQGEIWTLAVESIRSGASPAATSLLLGALNEMFDIATTRTLETQHHPPGIVLGMLFTLAILASVLAGHAMAATPGRSWTHVLGFAVVISLTVYTILDVEYPRLGLIRVDHFDEPLVRLLESFGPKTP